MLLGCELTHASPTFDVTQLHPALFTQLNNAAHHHIHECRDKCGKALVVDAQYNLKRNRCAPYGLLAGCSAGVLGCAAPQQCG